MAKSVRTEAKIGLEVGLIKFFHIQAPNSGLHDFSELSNDENLDFLSKNGVYIGFQCTTRTTSDLKVE